MLGEMSVRIVVDISSGSAITLTLPVLNGQIHFQHLGRRRRPVGKHCIPLAYNEFVHHPITTPLIVKVMKR